MKVRELIFYKNLRLDKLSKEKIFGIDITDENNSPQNNDINNTSNNNNYDKDNLKKEKINSVNGKVIVQDPLKGNLIMTVEEYQNVYMKNPQNFE
ncbi:hypothetical protein IMG5_064410 [Ichthyophthirius multifiliis]|uniref:Uncharacterized protein n=1 Tax=Ichthyophthirius multifiliis TaxID=5932 RepID=G0QP56_ICHMU|nr:hypothetical protein IMG5_064410 [Ichthyophthirius multifiliis]EGR32986.1 hypothetical protein IMG5_064410 [Ichthyophthirius multifiliis]|eukprot:XP_004036972.1 hypothetical protein IMG5_064410 [Ichthyophthirius multifiliis]